MALQVKVLAARSESLICSSHTVGEHCQVDLLTCDLVSMRTHKINKRKKVKQERGKEEEKQIDCKVTVLT